MKYSFVNRYQQLIDAQNQTFEAIESLDNVILNTQIISGKWSIIQILEHVRVSEKQIYNAIQKHLALNQKLKKPGVIHYLRFYIVLCIFKLRIPLKAPSFVSRISDDLDIKIQREKWLETRNNWLSFLNNLNPELENKILMIHPLVGPMDLYITIQFMLAHFNVHKMQIQRLLKLL